MRFPPNWCNLTSKFINFLFFFSQIFLSFLKITLDFLLRLGCVSSVDNFPLILMWCWSNRLRIDDMTILPLWCYHWSTSTHVSSWWAFLKVMTILWSNSGKWCCMSVSRILTSRIGTCWVMWSSLYLCRLCAIILFLKHWFVHTIHTLGKLLNNFIFVL